VAPGPRLLQQVRVGGGAPSAAAAAAAAAAAPSLPPNPLPIHPPSGPLSPAAPAPRADPRPPLPGARPPPQAAARRARCAAFCVVAALVRCTQTAPRFYAVALDSKDDRWGGLVVWGSGVVCVAG
jgi:hypothetical protein